MADLLLCFIDRTTASPTGSAILVQAKQYDSTTFSLTDPKEKVQFDLLSRRPVFDVHAKSKPEPKGVDLGMLTPDRALMYGLCEPDSDPPINTPATHRWMMADGLNAGVGTYSGTANHCLAPTMVQMMTGRAGWDFDLPPSGSDWQHFASAPHRDDWSMLVNYLLEGTMAHISAYVPTTTTNTAGARGADNKMYLTATAPSGDAMFCFGSYAAGAARAPLSWLSPATSGSGPAWTASVSHPLRGGSGEPPAASERLDDDEEGGPISAIVFELSSSEG